ncbi:MAG: flagellar type III secretion system protein FlhB [Paracoccaceae bacterium]
MSDSDADSKEHEPSQKKLDDAREKGDVVRSTDLTAAAAFGGFLIAALAFGQAAMIEAGSRAKTFLGTLDLLAGGAGASAPWGIAGWALAICLPVLPFFLLPGLAALATLLAQRALTFSGEKLLPKLSRIDPIKNAGQKFGRGGIFEFAKSTVKLVIVAALFGWFIFYLLPDIILSMRMEPAPVSALLMEVTIRFVVLITAITGLIGGIDWLWQYFEHIRRNRMSRQEMMDEYRSSEGDPQMKAQRRSRAQEIAMNRMLADVPKADVIIVNPTHFAVALKWNRASGRAPICLAKGTDEVAARIREAAMAATVPIHSDPPTARALHATVEIGQEIGPEHYAPVAAAIRYAEKMRKRARDRRGY